MEKVLWDLITSYLKDVEKLTGVQGLKLWREVLITSSPPPLPRAGGLMNITTQYVEIKEGDSYMVRPTTFGVTGENLARYGVGTVPTEAFITTFRLGQLPGCCAFTLSTGAIVDTRYRKLGVQRRSLKFREDLSKLHGYTAMLCTDVIANIPERKVLANADFKDILTLVNKRTNNKVALSVKEWSE